MAAAQVTATTLVNGGFEEFTGTFASNGTAGVVAGQTTLTGWSPINQTAILRDPNVFNLTPASGTRFLDLTSGSVAGGGAGYGVSQMLSDLTVGASYTVSFALGASGLPCVSGGINCRGPFTVNVDVGSVTKDFSHSTSLPENEWERFSLDFVANGTEATLQFTLVSVVGFYAGLDDVRVAVVPEASTYAMMGLGLLVLGAWRRRAVTGVVPTSV
jgi:hypothetical protein